MARLWSDGAEHGDILRGDSWSAENGLSVVSAGTSGATIGNYSYYLANTPSEASCTHTMIGIDNFYFRCRYKIHGSHAIYFQFKDVTGVQLQITPDSSTGFYKIEGSGMSAAYSSGHSLVADTWYLFELYYDAINNPGTQHITIKQDGIVVYDFQGSGDMNSATIVRVQGDQMWFDDIALNSLTGGNDNTWPGASGFIGLPADSNGTTNQFAPLSGSNYQNVSIPANDATYNTGTAGQTDEYNLSTTTLGAYLVQRVFVMARAKNAASGSANIGLRTHSVNYTASKSLPTSFGWVIGTEYLTNPNTNVTWTQSELDALQFHIDV